MPTTHLSLQLLANTLPLPLTLTQQGIGQPYVLLHGAAGPGTMRPLSEQLAQTGQSILPVHPGYDNTPRPAWCHRIRDLVGGYLALLEKLDLQQVVLVGNSMGGWLGAELALRASPLVAALVLLNAAGLEATPSGGALLDIATIPPAQRTAYLYHDPSNLLSAGDSNPAADAQRVANQQATRLYGGVPFMIDPTLRQRLPGLRVPTLVLWGGK